jgi:hypothetical protein
MGETPEKYYCRICQEKVIDKAALVEHLREEHEILEALSYAASTMITEEDRDIGVEMSFTRARSLSRLQTPTSIRPWRKVS